MKSQLASTENPVYKLVFIYTLLSSISIIFADIIFNLFTNKLAFSIQVEILKDWGFILSTSGLLYVLIRTSLQLQQSEQNYHRLFENAAEGIYQVTNDGRYISANPALARIYGYNSPSDLISNFHWHASNLELYQLLQKSDVVTGFESQVNRPDSSCIWTSSNVRAVRDRNGKLLYYEGTVEDITSRRRTEQALFDSKEQYRVISELTSDAYCIRVAPDGQIITEWVSEAFLQVSGYTFAEISTPEGWRQLIHPDDWLKVQQNLLNLVSGHSGITEYRIVTRSGEIRWLRDSARSQWDEPQQRVIRILGTLEDITERKAAEALIQRSSGEINQIFNMLPSFVWKFCPATTQFIHASEILTELSGISTEAFFENYQVWDDRVDLGHESQEAIRIAWEAITKGEPYQVVYLFHTLHRGDRWFEITARPVIEDGILYYYGSTADISERQQQTMLCKQAETALRQANEALEIRVQERTAELEEVVQALQGEIAERKLAQETLKHYQLLSEHARDIVLFIGHQGQIIEANQAAIQAYGYEREEILTLNIQDLRDPPTQIAIAQALEQAEDRGILFTTTHRRKDGSTFPVEVSCQSWVIDNQRVLLSIIRDISESLRHATLRKLAEEALQKSEERFRNLLETTSDWVWELDENAIYTYSSPKVRDILGYEPEEVLGKTPFDFMPPEEAFRIANTFGPIAAQAIPFSCLENINIPKNGHRVVLETSGVPIFDASGKFRGYRGIDRDITERKQAEEALRESEERFRTIFEREAMGVVLTTLEGRLLASNPKFQEILGYSEQELQGMLFTELTHPDDVMTDWELYQALIAGNRDSYQLEKRYICKDGHVAWGYLTVSLIRTANGAPQFSTATIQDITERKQIEAALRESEERFRQLAENIPQVFWMTTPDEKQMLYISPAYEQVWGQTCESLYQQPESWLDSIYPEDRQSVIDGFEKRQQEVDDYEYRIIRPDGTIRWIRDRSFPVRDEVGQVYRIAGIAEDITERKRTEEEVRFLQTMTHAIFESQDFHSALFIALQKVCEATGWDFGEAWIPRSDGSVLECSPAWYSRADSLEEFRKSSQVYTFPPGTGLPGRVWVSKQPEWRRDVSIESNQVYLRGQQAMKAGLKAALGIPIVNHDSVLTVLVFYMFESREEDERLIELISASTELGLFMQRKRAEEEIHSALEKEKELHELKSRFVSMTSHEFRTPLATILFSAGLLENYGFKWTEDKKKIHLHRIQTAVQRMNGMLDEVLLIGKTEAGKTEFNPAPIELETFCQDLVAEMQLTAGDRHSLIFTSKGACPAASIDEKLLRHILSNLLSNGIKYTPGGGIIKCELTCHNGEATFQIKDQGIGIPPQDRQRLFETFHRASNVGNIPGTGLGLAIIKKFVDLHKGQITVESEVGVGTTFTIKLPLNEDC
ncbi:PAS domain S-box protein [Coleofasciculus sp. FACHB-1120]|uniref:sensor histidine kinase n=1 Tax=Coleofasciculus sp. FACHB-1120 TaxID=2692783 RepID=UPI001681E83B|nr:PAS domain S-box protein [Coleofasciculus sp. FACHB-1120]MBD2742903.1 PAS domain S-box protein [Coleofasciculus sp. FACHB-1120]